ncbi:MAG: PAS domain S-box protein, partial [Bacteroidota bacterium]
MTPPPDILREISALYELALAVGTSLDARESARTFLDTLVARRGLSYAAVWLRSDAADPGGADDSLDLLYAVPAARADATRHPAAPLEAVLGGRPFASLSEDEPGFEALQTERGADGGGYALYRLGQVGVLKLYDGLRQRPFAPRELAQLQPVVQKFAVALEGALAHEWLARETAAREAAALETDALRRFYEQVLEAMPAQLAVFDPDARYRYVTPSAIRDPERRAAVIGNTDEDYARLRGLDPEIPRRRMETILRVARTGEALTFEESFPTQSGEPRHFIRFISPVVGADGEVTQVLGYGLDVSEQKNSERALLASEARQRAIVDAALDAVVSIDAEGRLLTFNPAAEAIFGHREADVLGENMADLLVPERLRAAHARGMAHYLATGEGPVLGKRIELPALRADGSEFPAEISIHPIAGPGGARAFTAFMRDISERKAAEEALAESESRYKQLVEESQDLIYRADLDGRFTYVNAVATRITGFSEDQLLGMPFTQLVAPGHCREVIEFYLRQLAAREANTYLEFPFRTASGDEVWVGQNVQLLEDDGAVVGVQAVARDVTERGRVMQALVEAREAAE